MHGPQPCFTWRRKVPWMRLAFPISRFGIWRTESSEAVLSSALFGARKEMVSYTGAPAVNQVEVHPYFQQKDLVKFFGNKFRNH